MVFSETICYNHYIFGIRQVHFNGRMTHVYKKLINQKRYKSILPKLFSMLKVFVKFDLHHFWLTSFLYTWVIRPLKKDLSNSEDIMSIINSLWEHHKYFPAAQYDETEIFILMRFIIIVQGFKTSGKILLYKALRSSYAGDAGYGHPASFNQKHF